jgi:hypothetical protein
VPRALKSEEDGPVQPTTFRFTEKHKWGLALLARQMKKDKVVVLQDLIEAACLDLDIGRHWEELYDKSEAVRTLNCLSLPDYAKTTAEKDLLKFIEAHRRFFYSDKHAHVPRRAHVEALWPRMKEYHQLWLQTKDENSEAAAKEMAKDLKKAKLEAPK